MGHSLPLVVLVLYVCSSSCSCTGMYASMATGGPAWSRAPRAYSHLCYRPRVTSQYHATWVPQSFMCVHAHVAYAHSVTPPRRVPLGMAYTRACAPDCDDWGHLYMRTQGGARMSSFLFSETLVRNIRLGPTHGTYGPLN